MAEWGSEQIQDLVDLSGVAEESAEALYHARPVLLGERW